MNTALAQATFAWLLTYALHSTVLLAATWIALRGRRFAPAVADVAWKTALVGGVITATMQGAIERRPAGSLFLGAAAVEQLVSGTPSSRASGEQAGEQAARDAAISQPSAAPTQSTPAVVPSAALDDATNGAASTNANASGLRFDSLTFAAGAWFLIALALVAWYTGRRLILVGRLGDRRPVVDGNTLAMFEELRRDTRARASVRLTASATISSPVALGGEICLPAAALVELEPEQRRAMLAHELAHLERRDPAWLAFACVMERAFFFQPLNRLARRGLQENAEYLADEWAARHSGGVQLAKALVKVAEWMQSSPLSVPVAGFAEERSQLTVRVTRLLDGVARAPSSRLGAIGFAAAVLMLTTAFAPGVAAGTAPSFSTSQDPTNVTAERDPITLPGDEAAADDEGQKSATDLQRTETQQQTERRTEQQQLLAESGVVAFTDTAIVRAVMMRLRDEDAEVRLAAADALGRMQHPMAIDALVIALDDLDGDVRRAALHALSNFEHSRVPAPPIRRMLENADAEIRSTAVQMLAELRDRTAIPAITRLLTDEQEDVRYSALNALEELEAPVSDEVVARALADVSSEVREAAASLAGERQVVGVVPQLIRLLEDRSGSVREAAAHALTEMRTPASHEALRRSLTHKDSNVRRIAVEYFGEEVDK